MDWYKQGFKEEFDDADYEKFVVKLIHETEKAILVEYDDQEIWLPKSQLDDFDEFVYQEKDIITIEVADWLVEEKEMG